MTRKNYKNLAWILGNAFADAKDEETREAIYDSVYCPLVDYLKSDNTNFDYARFAYFTAQVEHGKVKAYEIPA